MNWLFDNPLANLPGNYFLLLYAVVIVTALIVYRFVKANLDATARMPLPPIPAEPDPFEIAFLRGGTNELARSVVFDLTRKGFLNIRNDEKNSWIEQRNANANSLKPLERSVFQYFAGQPREPKDLFAKGGLTATLQPFATTYEARLRQQQFLVTDEMKARLQTVTLSFAAIILGFGGYKLLAALFKGYSNVWFLIIMAIVGTLFLFGMGGLPRVTKLGQAYLERLQLAFERLRYAPQNANAAEPLRTGATFNTIDPMLLTVGLFGAGVLAGGVYDSYNQAFYRSQPASMSSGSSCGSSCGTSWDSTSSSDSSSGDSGGGDGGSSCGGGGCGGCGGGCS